MIIALYLLGAFVFFQVVVRLARRRFSHPAPAWIAPLLGSPTRRLVQPPRAVMDRSGVEKGMKVLEVGCGNGLFSLAAARTIGGDGSVFALDIQRSMLRLFKRKIDKEGGSDKSNVHLVEGDALALPFAGASFDRVFLVTALPEVSDPNAALCEVRRVLRPAGKLAVSEFFIDPDYPLRSTVVRWGREAGFEPEASFGNFFSYTVRFRKENSD